MRTEEEQQELSRFIEGVAMMCEGNPAMQENMRIAIRMGADWQIKRFIARASYETESLKKAKL